MKKERRKFTSSFKAKVAIEAIKEDMTIQELSVKHQVDLPSNSGDQVKLCC
ncbi:MAG: hypothetical protein KA210_01780 [Bacteroidia bacterium]|nr:hypothetical protein [Bacteroidia bacterium]